MSNLDIFSNQDLNFAKGKPKEVTLSSYETYNNNVP